MELISIKHLAAALIYSVLGILILVVAFWIMERLTPENLFKEIIEKRNNALAIVAGAFILAIAIIVASAIH
jgi:putative membrane protein